MQCSCSESQTHACGNTLPRFVVCQNILGSFFSPSQIPEYKTSVDTSTKQLFVFFWGEFLFSIVTLHASLHSLYRCSTQCPLTEHNYLLPCCLESCSPSVRYYRSRTPASAASGWIINSDLQRFESTVIHIKVDEQLWVMQMARRSNVAHGISTATACLELCNSNSHPAEQKLFYSNAACRTTYLIRHLRAYRMSIASMHPIQLLGVPTV